MQTSTITLNGFVNTQKVMNLLTEMNEKKNLSFTHFIHFLTMVRREHKLKVDTAFLRFLIKQGKLRLAPFKYTGASGDDTLMVKKMLLDMFEHRIQNNTSYKAMYADSTPLFPDNLRITNSEGYFLYPDARTEVQKELLKLGTQRKQPSTETVTVDGSPTVAAEDIPVLRVIMNPENMVISMGNVTTIYSGQIIYTDNR